MKLLSLIFFFFILTLSLQDVNAETKTIHLEVLDDTFITTNIFDENTELNNKNFGNLPSLDLYYVDDSKNNDRFLSVILLKFDLSFLTDRNQINSAKLFLKEKSSSNYLNSTINTTFSKTTQWSESSVTFNSRPFYSASYVASGPTVLSNGWHYWDVKDIAVEFVGRNMTLVSGIKEILIDNSEKISYFSKDNDDQNLIPYLEIEYVEDLSPKSKSTEEQLMELQEKIKELESRQNNNSNEGGGCLIATATYGSELAIQVQQLRELRDNHLLQTETGSAFMESFNSFYYSFSPYIADLERQSPIFKEIVKLGITPMISSLSILNHVDMDSEAEVLSYGIGIIMLNIGLYFAVPIVIIYKIQNICSQKNII